MTKNELIRTRGKRQKTIGGIVPLTQVDNLLTLLLLTQMIRIVINIVERQVLYIYSCLPYSFSAAMI